MNSITRFWREEAKYLAAYIVIILPFIGLYLRGNWVFLAPLILFGLIPLLELLFKGSKANHKLEYESKLVSNRVYDYLLYLNLPLLYGLLYYYLWTVSNMPLSWGEHVGLALSVGMACGAIGINVGHELGHRKAKHERLIAQGLLLGSLYMHFFIEHNKGHHRHVATPKDPASSRQGEVVYSFWFRSITGGFLSAWRIERKRLERNGQKVFSLQNQMIQFQLIQLLAVLAIAIFLSWEAMAAFIVVSILGALMLETVNYLEHYGLQRKETKPGVY